MMDCFLSFNMTTFYIVKNIQFICDKVSGGYLYLKPILCLYFGLLFFVIYICYFDLFLDYYFVRHAISDLRRSWGDLCFSFEHYYISAFVIGMLGRIINLF